MNMEILEKMEILEEQNPLKVTINSRITTNDKTVKFNTVGRPKKVHEVKFGPEPKSIVSQLLKKKTKKEKSGESPILVEVEEFITKNDEPPSKKKLKVDVTKRYNCEYSPCTYTTTSSSNMVKHKRRHTSEKPYMCDQCSFRTNFINSLTVHKRIHSGYRPFVCEHCSYSCNSSSNLKKHQMHKHTGIT